MSWGVLHWTLSTTVSPQFLNSLNYSKASQNDNYKNKNHNKLFAKKVRRGHPFGQTHESTRTHTHTHTHALSHTQTHAHPHTHTRARTHTRTHTHTRAQTHARAHARTHSAYYVIHSGNIRQTLYFNSTDLKLGNSSYFFLRFPFLVFKVPSITFQGG